MRAPVSFQWSVAALAVVALVAVWGGYAQVSRAVLESQTREAVAGAETMARAFEKSTYRAVHEVDVALRTFAMEFAESGLPQARRIIDLGLFDSNLIHHFGVLDPAGDLIFRSEGKGDPANLRDDPLFAHHAGLGQDLMHIGRPDPAFATGGRPLLRLSRRLADSDGGFAGVVIANIDPDYFSDMYRQTNIGPHGSVTLIGLDRVIRARGIRQGVDAIGTAIPNSRLWDELGRSPSGVYQQDTLTDGLRRIYAYRVVEGYPLVVAVGIEQGDLKAVVADLQDNILVIALLLSGSVVLVAVFLLVQHRNAERLQAALNVNRDFLARVSHELRTPLNAIIGFSEVIKDQMLGPQAGRRYADYAKDIHDSGRHLLTLIDDILDLSRLQAGQLALRMEPVNLIQAIDWAMRNVACQAESKRIRVEMDVHPDIRCIMADERALKQMLLNLLSNAVKFTPDGGRILVTAARGPRGRHHLRVVDNGIGMTPEQVRQAFVPFGQTSAMTTHEGQGTGLGLSIVKSLVEAHGGSLRIDSRPGRGSQVTLEFAA